MGGAEKRLPTVCATHRTFVFPYPSFLLYSWGDGGDLRLDRKKLIVDAIRKSLQDKGFPPTVRELQAASGLKSTSSVHLYLRRLEEMGVIRRDPGLSRGIELAETRPRARDVPLVGRVQAGLPVLAEQNLVERLALPSSWIPEGAFALTVSGDSMIEAGIAEGDVVFVDPGARAEEGDIVVALLGDEATVKFLYQDKGLIRLEPANRRYQPIITREARILGKVTGLYRRLG